MKFTEFKEYLKKAGVSQTAFASQIGRKTLGGWSSTMTQRELKGHDVPSEYRTVVKRMIRERLKSVI